MQVKPKHKILMCKTPLPWFPLLKTLTLGKIIPCSPMTLLGSSQFSLKASLNPHHSQIFVLSSASTMAAHQNLLSYL